MPVLLGPPKKPVGLAEESLADGTVKGEGPLCGTGAGWSGVLGTCAGSGDGLSWLTGKCLKGEEDLTLASPLCCVLSEASEVLEALETERSVRSRGGLCGLELGLTCRS